MASLLQNGSGLFIFFGSGAFREKYRKHFGDTERPHWKKRGGAQKRVESLFLLWQEFKVNKIVIWWILLDHFSALPPDWAPHRSKLIDWMINWPLGRGRGRQQQAPSHWSVCEYFCRPLSWQTADAQMPRLQSRSPLLVGGACPRASETGRERCLQRKNKGKHTKVRGKKGGNSTRLSWATLSVC